jgi:hypothetical protein
MDRFKFRVGDNQPAAAPNFGAAAREAWRRKA